MASEWINIDQLGTKGIEPDLMPPHRDTMSLDEAVNVRALGPNLANAGGYTAIVGANTPVPVNTLFLGKSVNKRVLILPSQAAVHRFDGTSWTDVTGNAVDDGADARWTGGWLTGSVFLANQKAVRTFQPGVDVATRPVVYNGGTDGPGDETWESKTYSAQVFRPFRQYMLAANLDWGGSRFPSRVQWCHPVEPGQVPVDWVPRDTNRAGDVDLADTPGSIVDMHPLRDAMMIYKRDSIVSCSWIGGNDVFAFKTLTKSKGIHARDCVVEYNGYNWCQGIEDVFMVDGNTSTSLLWGKIKRSWLADRDEERALNNWTVLDPVNEEVLFGYVSKNAPGSYTYPDRALVLSLRNNMFTTREYGIEMPHAKASLDVVNQDSANLVFNGINRTGSRLLDLEAAPDRLGASVPAWFTRTGLFADPGHDWVQVDEAKVQISGSVCKLTLGGQVAIDAPVTWRTPYDVDPTADYRTDTRQNDNLIAYRVDVQTLTDWQIANLMLKVQKSGSRG